MLIAATVKFIVAPYTPLNAYIALFLQGGLGWLLFSGKISYRASSFLLALITIVISSLQRIIIYTVVFGLTLWDSINLFYDFVLKQLALQNTFLAEINFSWFIILFYVVIHFVAGIIIGLFSAKLPEKIENVQKQQFSLKLKEAQFIDSTRKGKKRKSFLRKPSVMIILSLSIILIALSYSFPGIAKSEGEKIIVMLVRVISVLLIWYLLLLPIVTKFLNKLLKKTELKYKTEIESIILDFSSMKNLVFESWKMSRKSGKVKRFVNFFFYIIVFIIYSGLEDES